MAALNETRPCQRFYGSFKVCSACRNESVVSYAVSVTTQLVQWRCSLPTCISQDHKLHSPEFTVGSFSWSASVFLNAGMPDLACLFEEHNSSARPKEQGLSKIRTIFFLYLLCYHPPAVPVTAQLWIANQDNPDASKARSKPLICRCADELSVSSGC